MINSNLSDISSTKLTDVFIITTQQKTSAKCNVDAHVSVTFDDDTPTGYKLISVMYRSNSTAYVHWHRTNTVVSLVHLLGANDLTAPTITRTAVYAKSTLF